VFTNPENINLTSKNILLVTHTSQIWDVRHSSKLGMDNIVKKFKRENYPVVYLQGSSLPESYFYEDCSPSYYVLSKGGEFSFEFDSPNVFTAGGYFGACQRKTVMQILKYWKKKYKNKLDLPDLQITYITDSVYSHYHHVVSSDDIFYDDILNYIRIFGAEVITLLEMERIIHESDGKKLFYKRYFERLSNFNLFPDKYQVEVWVDNINSFTLQTGSDRSPTLKFNFVQSSNVDIH